MQFKPFEKGIEVLGQTVYAVVDGFALFKKLPSKYLIEVGIGTLDSEGVIQIEPEKWYPQEAWLTAFENISNKVGQATLYKIGLRIPENAKLPPFVTDINTAISTLNIAYHMNHRKDGKEMFDPESGKVTDGIGYYGYQPVEGENKILSECKNPYPCEFDRGILTSMSNRFEKSARVTHDNTKPCRNNGAESCSYIINW